MGNANGRSVWSCVIDIEFPDGMNINNELNYNGKVFKAVSKALESVGCNMAGDFMSAEYDQTDTYEANDYFEESLKESYGVYRIGGIGYQLKKWADQGIPSKEFKDKDGFVNIGFLVKTFDNLEDAKSYARERRKEVSRDELWQTGRSYKVAKTNDEELDYDWEPETKEKSTKRKTDEESLKESSSSNWTKHKYEYNHPDYDDRFTDYLYDGGFVLLNKDNPELQICYGDFTDEPSMKVVMYHDKDGDMDYKVVDKSELNSAIKEYKELLLTDDDLDESSFYKKEEDLVPDSTKTFTVEYTSGNSMSREETYSAIDVKEAIDEFVKTHTDDDYIVGVYDEYGVEYDPESGEEI